MNILIKTLRFEGVRDAEWPFFITISFFPDLNVPADYSFCYRLYILLTITFILNCEICSVYCDSPI